MEEEPTVSIGVRREAPVCGNLCLLFRKPAEPRGHSRVGAPNAVHRD